MEHISQHKFYRTVYPNLYKIHSYVKLEPHHLKITCLMQLLGLTYPIRRGREFVKVTNEIGSIIELPEREEFEAILLAAYVLAFLDKFYQADINKVSWLDSTDDLKRVLLEDVSVLGRLQLAAHLSPSIRPFKNLSEEEQEEWEALRVYTNHVYLMGALLHADSCASIFTCARAAGLLCG
ncbi:hypothetical protein EON65_55880 [archaeon]|nr:MAG: hypothetical protein EON65_55880 [archaeon]